MLNFQERNFDYQLFYNMLVCTDIFLGVRLNHRDLLRARGNIHIFLRKGKGEKIATWAVFLYLVFPGPVWY
jgi:hypothetical protein